VDRPKSKPKAKPDRCPECGSGPIVETTRHHSVDGDIHAYMCEWCHWISDPRIGRPPADHSKNVTLRRLMQDITGGSTRDEPSEAESADER